MNRNRRKSLRTHTSVKPCVVRLGIGEDQGFVIDESDEGIRIGGLDLLVLFADQKVTVLQDNRKVVGRCRVVLRDIDGLFQIGVYRETEPFAEDPQSLLLNSFMRDKEINRVCVPVDVVDEDHVRIRHLDGREFTVHRKELFQLTRSERMEELCDDDRLSAVMRLYSMTSSQNEFTNREMVLNHEFGPPVRSLLADRG
jgi:hypothetical protein